MSDFQDMVDADIAIVITDIIGSTKFVQRNGSRVAAKWFNAHDRLVMSLVTKHNGQWIDASDGTLMYFGTVSDAVAFAFQYKKSLRIHKFPFRSRIGIHWDKMTITKTAQSLVSGGAKRINIDGIGKNIAARAMSLCGEEQILLSKSAMMMFKKRANRNPFIPKKALSAFVGLYKFKGVAEPEQIYALGLIEAQLQPPPDSEKAKRIGGKKKVKVRLRNKRIMEIVEYFFWRIGFIATAIWIYVLWPLLSSQSAKAGWGIDYFFLVPFEWIDWVLQSVLSFVLWFWEGFKEHYLGK